MRGNGWRGGTQNCSPLAPREECYLLAPRDCYRGISYIRQRVAQLVTQAEVARVLGLRVVDASVKSEQHGAPPPTVEASVYKLYATEFSRRLANASMDIGGPGSVAAACTVCLSRRNSFTGARIAAKSSAARGLLTFLPPLG